MIHKMTLLVLQLAVVVITARFVGHIFSRYLKQPRVMGELVTGMIIGPYALGQIVLPLLEGPLFPRGVDVLPVSPELYGLATVASIVLLFLSGLETDLPTFLRYSIRGSVVGLGGVVVSFLIGDILGVLLLPSVASFLSPTALFLGTLSTATSVGITARILSERNKMSSPEGVTILAGAVLDDVVGIILLAVVVAVARVAQAGGVIDWSGIGAVALKALGFWLVCTAVGILVAPRLARGLKWFRSYDAVAGIALGIALLLAGLAEMAGLAMIIGAYIAGLALSQTDMANELRERLQGVYQFVVPVFFCVMGMLVDFSLMRGVLVFGLIYAAGAILGKLLGAGIPSLLMGFNLRGAFRVGAGMLPRGEVTLIVAGVGLSSGAIGPEMFGVAIMMLLVASVIAPPVLVKSFSSREGTRKQRSESDRSSGQPLVLELVSPRLAEFVRARIIDAFRSEEFFIHRVGGERAIYQIRKEASMMTLIQEASRITLNTSTEDDALARLVVLEAVADLGELVEGIRKIQSAQSLGSGIASGILSDPNPGDPDKDT